MYGLESSQEAGEERLDVKRGSVRGEEVGD